MHLPQTSPHSLAIERVAAALDVHLQSGLSTDAVQTRLATHGLNELPKPRRTPFGRRLLAQLRGAIVLILLAAIALSIALGDWIEAGVILAIVILNAVVGALQEARAESAIESLQEMSAPTARVIREGQIIDIAAKELVPGDVVVLETGAVVPTDLRLAGSSHLRIDESSLTGESAPIAKTANAVLDSTAAVADRVNCAFAGTTVTYGRGSGLVVATGTDTEFGKIAAEVGRVTDEPTPLQKKLDEFGRILGAAVLAVCALVFIAGLLRDPAARILFQDGIGAYITAARSTIAALFVVAIGLAIAAVPEGLPAVVTMSLALGTRAMLRRNALVRRLPSVETLGSTTVICTDKTGTLTQNRMTVRSIRTTQGEYEIRSQTDGHGSALSLEGSIIDLHAHRTVHLTLLAGQLCNDAQLIEHGAAGTPFIGDPTEGALLVAADALGLGPIETDSARIADVPFDSDRKRMATIHRMPDGMIEASSKTMYVAFVKGAPDELLALCTSIETENGPEELSHTARADWVDLNRTMGERGLRLLAFAYRPLLEIAEEPSPEDVEQDLTFLGLAALHDPPRPEVAAAVEKARRAGLRSIMITGDHATTARSIAEQIGILREGHRVATGDELNHMNSAELQQAITDTDVFARVSPQHKVQIVEALKANGEVVAMTGDGVNDAPALRRADVGIAMGITGTDVAKQTADIVLTDDNYATIVAAVEHGRIIYANIRKTVFYLLSCNFAEIAILLVSTLLGWPPPLTAIQLLWLNLVTDGAPALALAMENGEPGIMDRPPRAANARMVSGTMAKRIAFQATALTAAVLTAFGLMLRSANPDAAGTVAFATLAVAELFRAYAARSESTPLWRVGIFSNRWMQSAVLASFGLMLAVLHVPLLQPLFDVASLRIPLWGPILALGVAPALLIELRKILRPAWAGKRGSRQ